MTATEFTVRHLGVTTPEHVAKMLDTLGYDSVEQLTANAVPEDIRVKNALQLPEALSENAVQARLKAIAKANRPRVQMIGQGFNDTFTPPVIRRNILENPAWYTAYTPYQAEISQGRLEALLNFQTVITELTGLPVANASLLDEASAAAEAMLLMRRATKHPADARVIVDENVFPQTLNVLKTRAAALEIPVEIANLREGLPAGSIFGIVLQQPAADGTISCHKKIVAEAHDRDALATVIADPLALTLITPPGEQGADIAVGSTGRFGVPLFFGGPHAAYMSVTEKLTRQIPGRIVGVAPDAEGKPALRLALQTREQHIRRERATSNICTAQALLAVTASMYAVYHGPHGLKEIAARTHAHAATLAAALRDARITVTSEFFFDTLNVSVPGRANKIVAAARDAGVNLRLIDENTVGISCSETTTAAHLATVASAFDVPLTEQAAHADTERHMRINLPEGMRRETDFMRHEVFNSYHSETQLLRYTRKLQDRDLALDRSMIPLGSCTMKLNSATQMEPISWPELSAIHPYAPGEDAAGWRQLINELAEWLAEITGYAKVSMQPNSGATGEYAGLMAIRGYHAANGEKHRDVCLIPASAHGTNAASAMLAGFKVVVVKNTPAGAIDGTDFEAKLAEHGKNLAAIMITYPSTYGVYDADVRHICARVHEHGGQVYIDGANMNALVGLARPGDFGGDVSHLNLHKTFAIPHGGGGPGVGPIGVAAHLAPFLPGDPLTGAVGEGGGAIAAAAFGSAGVLPITYAYIVLLGAEGLRKASEHAILAANYIAVRLSDAYPVLFTGETGLVAHECILDLRDLTKLSGVTAEDVAKRLIDYGFHAPTLAFPVPGTLMVEPTESEDLAELDRFVTAMRGIREEIQDVIDGKIALRESPLRLSPHTAQSVTADVWNREYTRQQAAYPASFSRLDKYFPPVARIDGAHGDRNLVCQCAPPEAYAQ